MSLSYSGRSSRYAVFPEIPLPAAVKRPFVIPVFGVPVPGVINIGKFNVGPIKASVGAEASISASGSASANYDVGAGYNRGGGLRSQGKGADLNFGSGQIDGKWSATADMAVTLRGGIRVLWPDLGIIAKAKVLKKIYDKIINRRNRRGIVTSIKDWMEDIEIKGKFKFKLRADASIDIGQKLILRAGFCDTETCSDVQKPNSAQLSLGNTVMRGKFHAFIVGGSLQFPIARFEKGLSKTCAALPTSWDTKQRCCLCKNDDGTIAYGMPHPEKKECMCRCECRGEQKQMSWKMKNSECSCCPDGSAKPLDDLEFECPCECEDETRSTIGPEGCRCEPCDPCPDGRVVKKKPDGTCPCDNECGFNGVCVPRRAGPNCDKPVCPPDSSCSGNGVCTAQPNCGSRCVCIRGWAGRVCEEREPTRNWGDPHLGTLDGKTFDYFGIGQFWGCKSSFLEYQYRFYGFKRTSFIGAVAIRLGKSAVLTVNSRIPAKSNDLPIVRLNGLILEDIEKNNKFTFDNKSLRLDISSKPKGLSTDDPTVLYLTIKYSNGAALSLISSFSSKMERQYLSLIITPVNEMLNETSGICGFFNDNDSDDFIGPDGKFYSSPVDFVESWRITKTIRNGAGVKNSWSGSESNFHPLDSIDKSYIDPTHVPIYSLRGFTASQIKNAEEVCYSDKLTNSQRDQCIFDVVITDDPNISNQAVLKANECPEECSNRGNCVNGKCFCIEGWSGEICEIGQCGKCVNGNCSAGFCKCLPGFEGPSCELEAICEGQCSSRGICVKSGVCKCDVGWTSNNCSEEATCLEGCSNNGICIDHGLCKCEIGYKGRTCDQFSCKVRNKCSGHGICIAFDQCLCHKEYSGLSCSDPVCENDCSGHGKCLEPGKCKCEEGFIGVNCSSLKECPAMNNCNNHGICKNETECVCDNGYAGIKCDKALCDPECSINGVCVSPNKCECQKGYKGETCSEYSCEDLAFCSKHGTCISFDYCACDDFWFGASCNIPSCSGVSDCTGNGRCIAVDKCVCDEGYEGTDCSLLTQPNKGSPIFTERVYMISVSENAPIGEYLLTVQAEDTDVGDPGIVEYSLGSFDLPISIDVSSGVLKTTDKMIPGNYLVNVVASDKGIPSKEDNAILNITVIDINECSKFTYPKSGMVLTVNSSLPENSTVMSIKAVDEDYSDFSDLMYDVILRSADIENVFTIFNDTEEVISTISPLPTGMFETVVTVSDKSSKPCTSSITFTVNIVSYKIQKEILQPIERTTASITTDVPITTTITVQSTLQDDTTMQNTPTVSILSSTENFAESTGEASTASKENKKHQKTIKDLEADVDDYKKMTIGLIVGLGVFGVISIILIVGIILKKC